MGGDQYSTRGEYNKKGVCSGITKGRGEGGVKECLHVEHSTFSFSASSIEPGRERAIMLVHFSLPPAPSS